MPEKPYDVAGRFSEVARRAHADQEAQARRRRPSPAATPPPPVQAADGRIPDLPPSPFRAPERPRPRTEALEALIQSGVLTRNRLGR
jgi:hypothetical protein